MSEEFCKFGWLLCRKGGSKVQVFGVKAIQGFNWGGVGEVVLVNFYKGSLGIKGFMGKAGEHRLCGVCLVYQGNVWVPDNRPSRLRG
jgi:hypothetical protein